MAKVNSRIIRFFDALADETRLKILLAISKGPITVNDIHNALQERNLTLSAISHQLKTMSDLDIIRYEKKGREKYFRLSDAYCWCPLRDAISKFNDKTKCPHCADIMMDGGGLI